MVGGCPSLLPLALPTSSPHHLPDRRLLAHLRAWKQGPEEAWAPDAEQKISCGKPGFQDRELRLPLGLRLLSGRHHPVTVLWEPVSASDRGGGCPEKTGLSWLLSAPGPTSHSPCLQGLRVLFENPSELLSVGGHPAGPSWTQGCHGLSHMQCHTVSKLSQVHCTHTSLCCEPAKSDLTLRWAMGQIMTQWASRCHDLSPVGGSAM